MKIHISFQNLTEHSSKGGNTMAIFLKWDKYTEVIAREKKGKTLRINKSNMIPSLYQ